MKRIALAAAWLPWLVSLAGCPAKKPEIKPPNAAAIERERQAVQAFNRAVAKLSGSKGDYHGAVAELEQAIDAKPDFFEAHYDLGVLFDRGNDFARSEAAYRAALAARPRDRKTLFDLASVYRKSGRLDDAIDLLEGFIELHPDDFEARNNLAVLYRTKGDYDRAIDQARYVLDRDSTQVLAYNNLATTFSEQGRHTMAEDLFRRALDLDPDNPRVLNNLGLARRNSGKIQEALEMFTRAWSKQPPLPEAGLNAASIYMDSADYARAAATYRQVARRVPGTLPALVGAAVAERGLGRLEQAEKAYQQILGLDPTNPDTLFNLGLLYMNHRDKPVWACEAFQRFLGSGRTTPELVKRAEGYIADIRLANPEACPEKKGEQ